MADAVFDVKDEDVNGRIKMALGKSTPFVATKFGREYSVCDEDCAEFLSGARFEIPFPAKQSDNATMRQMQNALQKAWIILDGLRSYRDDAELLAILRSGQMEDAREAVRRAAMISVDCCCHER